MKKKHVGLFLIGIIVGGSIMFVILGFSLIPNVASDQTFAFAPTSQQLPRLIALEPTGLSQQAKQTPTSRIITSESEPASTELAVLSTPTPLHLVYEQQLEVIGHSVAGRPLNVHTFGNGEKERMIVAGIHGGDEWNTITLANQLIEHFNQNPDDVPDDITLYILPSLNPDGEARAHNKYGRLNQNGVDLNRNFPVNWLKDWDRAGCWNSLPTSGGTEPGSEAETQVLMNFITGHNIQALISHHSAALGIFPGGLPWDEDAIRLARSIAAETPYRFPPIDTGCTYSGTLADYAVSNGIAAVDLELANHFDTDFDQNLRALDVLLHFEP